MTRIYDLLAPILGIGSAVLLLFLIYLVAKGPARKFWVFLAYISWECFASVGLTIADLYLNGSAQTAVANDARRIYARLFWTNDVLEDLFRVVVVSVFIYQVVEGTRPLLRRVLTGLVVAMIALPFVLYHPIFPPTKSLTLTPAWYPTGRWFNSASQLLNFGAAIMNVILWGLLIQSKRRHPQILMVSIGLGIMVTASAISYGLRHLIPQGNFTAAFNFFVNLSSIGAYLIWCRAFWPARARKDALTPTAPH